MKVEIGISTLYLADCLDVLPGLQLDVIVTDPPYGISAVMGMGGGTKGSGGMWKGVPIVGDESIAVRDAALGLSEAPFAAFASPRLAAPPRTKATLVWDKGEHTGAGDLAMPWKPHFELVHIAGSGWHGERRGSSIVRVNAVAGCVGNRNDGYRAHPFEKPLGIMEYLIAHAPPGVVCDPFMGSGTTGVACVNMGMPFVGIEIDAGFFETACERIKAAYAQQRLFA